MADMRLAIRRRRAIVKRERIIALALVDGLLRDVMILPELRDFLLALDEIEVGIYFLIQPNSLLKNEALIQNRMRADCHKKPPISRTAQQKRRDALFHNGDIRRGLFPQIACGFSRLLQRDFPAPVPRRLPPSPALFEFSDALLALSSHFV